MSALDKIIKEINMWRDLTNQREGYTKKALMSHPLTSDDVEDVVRKLEGELSPENLHCDGEISPAQAQKKYNHFMAAYNELCDRYACVREMYI